MASYVVRIYRAEAQDHPRLTGVVMAIEDETPHPFRNVSELWLILSGLESFEGREAPARRRATAHALLLE